MKFRVERDVLGEAVAWVARALPSRPVVPVLAGMLIEAGDGLVLSCFDYEVSARIRVDADVAEGGTALVPGRLLAEITRSLPTQPAEFTSSGEEVSLSCGGAEFTLVSLPAGDFPALPEPPPAAGTVDGGVLAAAAGQVVPAASRDDTLPMLTGVCLDFDGDTLTLAATDRYRLAVRELPWAPADPDVRAVALVPARTLADVARTMTAGVPVTIAFGVGVSVGGVGSGVGGVSSSGTVPGSPPSSAAGPRSPPGRSPRQSGACRWSPSGPARCAWRSALTSSWWRRRRRGGRGRWRPWPRTSRATSPSSPSIRTTCSMASPRSLRRSRRARPAHPAMAALPPTCHLSPAAG